MRIPGPDHLAIALLVTAVTTAGAAWAVQSSAAADLAEAHEIGQREVPSNDSPPPDLDDYHAILDTISDSVTIRRDIDELLGTVEETVAEFEEQRATAEAIIADALDQLAAIGRSLDSSLTAAEDSDSKLQTLGTRLERSAELAAAIARELEELDNSLGPSAGGSP